MRRRLPSAIRASTWVLAGTGLACALLAGAFIRTDPRGALLVAGIIFLVFALFQLVPSFRLRAALARFAAEIDALGEPGEDRAGTQWIHWPERDLRVVGSVVWFSVRGLHVHARGEMLSVPARNAAAAARRALAILGDGVAGDASLWDGRVPGPGALVAGLMVGVPLLAASGAVHVADGPALLVGGLAVAGFSLGPLAGVMTARVRAAIARFAAAIGAMDGVVRRVDRLEGGLIPLYVVYTGAGAVEVHAVLLPPGRLRVDVAGWGRSVPLERAEETSRECATRLAR